MPATNTVEKAIDLLFALHRSPSPQGVTELGRTLGVPKSSAHRLLRTLVHRGLVEQDESGRYRVGIGLVALGVGVLEREPIVEVSRDVLEEEARILGETVFLTVPRAGAMIVLDKAEGEGFLRAAPRVGSEVPIHATAVGKLAMAFAPEAFPLRDGAAAFTTRTNVTVADQAQELVRARVEGVAENHGEWIEGLSVVAAPILRRRPTEPPRFEGAVAIAASEPRLRSVGMARVIERARQAARRIEARLSGNRKEAA
jgi:IclR family acetate operon transcriptional repressor